MRVEVLIFGPVSTALQRDCLTVDVATGQTEFCTVAQVLQTLLDQHPAIRSFIGPIERARLAVNQRYADSNAQIKVGDEVALIAMVGGG